MSPTRSRKVPLGVFAVLCTALFALTASSVWADATSQVIVTKTNDTGGTINAGGTFHYEITSACNGPNGCNGLFVEDEVPANLTIVSAIDLSNNSACTITAQHVKCVLNGVGSSNSTDTVEITVQVPSSTDAGTIFTNCATAGSDGPGFAFCTGVDTPKNGCPGPSSLTGCDGDGFTVVVTHDLSVVKTLTTPASVPLGGVPGGTSLIYQVVATNNGPSTILQADMSVTDTVSGTVAGTITDVTVDSGNLDCGAGPWTSPVVCTATADWASGDTATFHITIAADNTSGTLTNTATVPEAHDADTSNNSSAVTTDICQSVDLAITKACSAVCAPPASDIRTSSIHENTVLPVCPSPITEIPGGLNFEYLITVTNNDALVNATNVTLNDALPAGVSFVSVSPNPCVTGTIPTNDCNLGTINAGASVSFAITVTAVQSGPVDNSASVSTPDFCERNATDNTADCQVTVNTNNMPTALEADREGCTNVSSPFCTGDPDSVATVSDVNRVFEPNETVRIDPTWKNTLSNADSDITGVASNFTGPGDGTVATYFIADSTADYGAIPANTASDCNSTGDCYGFTLTLTGARPAIHWDTTFHEVLSSGESRDWQLHIGDSFKDMPRDNQFYRFVETIFHNRITTGGGNTCTPDFYCSSDSLQRDQLSAFVTRAMMGQQSLVPPSSANYNCATGPTQFTDVPINTTFCANANFAKDQGIMNGCGGGLFCAHDPSTRGQVAITIARALEWIAGHQPPAENPDDFVPTFKQSTDLTREYNCTGTDQIDPDTGNTILANTGPFPDVDASSTFCKYVGFIWVNHIVDGFQNGTYGPELNIRRDESAKDMANAFVSLPLYGPTVFPYP
jgi:uncharacterized repeat protein (TIGR01451 family)